MASISCLDGNSKSTVSAPESNLDLPEVVHSDVQQETQSAPDAESPADKGPKACEDPRFIRFFKMIQFGVPLPAVKQKMETEGLDSSVLE